MSSPLTREEQKKWVDGVMRRWPPRVRRLFGR